MLKREQPRKKIVVEPYLHFGKVFSKPLCEESKKFAELFGNQNLSIANLQKIVDMGYDIDERLPSLIRPKLKNTD